GIARAGWRPAMGDQRAECRTIELCEPLDSRGAILVGAVAPNDMQVFVPYQRIDVDRAGAATHAAAAFAGAFSGKVEQAMLHERVELAEIVEGNVGFRGRWCLRRPEIAQDARTLNLGGN